ncbi:flagellar protein FlhE [Vogesella oryzae]|uniref:flagellar protein FlhE n=1 Tax=Vogesella oryzae TaxID=1735285 RepID=UPI001581945E|nr:flagellar protein FlhE [Vogesella oryzae]
MSRTARWPRLLAALWLASLPSLAAAGAGSYASDTVGPGIAVRNLPYRAAFPLQGTPPADGRITSVYYAWHFSPRPSELTVLLCQGSRCVNVSQDASGSTAAFRGLNPTQPFQLQYFVTGRGALMPVLSGKQQLAVSYEF